MDLVSILATVILVTTIGTMIIGVGAYAAFKLRDKRKPKRKVTDELQGDKIINEPIFLKRYVPESISETSPDAS
ncbi:MAG: hypothetical protein Q8K34_16545 [Hydrogenophaga sp.]|jgi:heme/copper-type cytochrome/quinol oxidase subunit 2|uniref:hypothetical protein n=1 Tax=Hydrogenophaga sp. TaxID=1904254 RepID=UPI002721407A|nr:hypothetical protein [Hydrogenophaga sp.]MDZ4058213.1 hypothetical protein [Polynucleobacter sp.]MDZ4316264.1 hypothetical protein [Azonexus sp.]MDO9480547.1 hypothetical protein [Hydrogenophaga sp.]MDO9604731.1 hypothetical protein [Hydrogenophaga sp.]MDP1894767.1 hypothetical protein [Hydrogenophaga sp.]